MELTEVLKIIWSRKLVTLAIVAIAVLTAVGVRLATRSTPKGAATVQILVDSPNSALANLVQNTTPLTARAAVFAQVMASEAVIEEIGKSAGIPASEITAEVPYSGSGEKLDVVTPSEARGNQLLAQGVPYKLTFVAQENEPVITASVQAPTEAGAARLANGIAPGLVAYVSSLQKTMNTPGAQRVTIRELGPPQAGTVSSGAGLAVPVVGGLGVLLLGLLALVGIEGARRQLASDPTRDGLTVDLDTAAHAAGFERVGTDHGVRFGQGTKRENRAAGAEEWPVVRPESGARSGDEWPAEKPERSVRDSDWPVPVPAGRHD